MFHTQNETESLLLWYKSIEEIWRFITISLLSRNTKFSTHNGVPKIVYFSVFRVFCILKLESIFMK